jgi:integrase
MSMPARRTKDLNLPPRMHRKGNAFYYVVRGKWTALGNDLNQARIKWAALENDGTNQATFAHALDTYMAQAIKTCSENTIRSYMGKVELLKNVFGKMPLDQIKPMHVARFIDSHPHKTSAKMCKAIMSATYSLAIRHGFAERNPCTGIEVNGIEKRDRYITDREYYAIRDKADDLVRCMMDLAYLTGMRISDVLKVKLTDINEDGLIVTQKKTGKRQIYRITPAIAKVIDKAKSLDRVIGSFYLFPNHKGQAFERRVFYFRWQKACKLAGIEDVHFHDLRAKAGTDAKALGQDYQSLLGHADRRMSDHYVKAREIDRVEPLAVEIEDSKSYNAK